MILILLRRKRVYILLIKILIKRKRYLLLLRIIEIKTIDKISSLINIL